MSMSSTDAPTVEVGSFVRRQTRESRFSYFDGSWEQLEALVVAYWSERKPGYRDGVVLVPVPVEGSTALWWGRSPGTSSRR